jgi:MFS family permease
MLFVGPLSGRLGGRLGSRVPLAIGGGVCALGLLVLALLHASQAEMVVGSLLLSIGVGFAFAAMPNLIVEAVPLEQTGEATGFNTLLRNVGASLGSQVSAAILAASSAAGALPSESGYTAAFLVCALIASAAAVIAFFIPRVREPAFV